jgi:DNA-binding Lrp family transcriptional regulator
MLWDPSDRVEADKTEGLDKLPLTPEHFFIVSRLDARPTVKELASGIGMSVRDVIERLNVLVEHGVAKKARKSRSRIKTDARQRQASRLRAALGGPAATKPPSTRSRPGASRPAMSRTHRSGPRKSKVEGADVPEGSEISGTFDLAAPGTPIDPILADTRDERLDRELGITIDMQRRVLGLHDKLEQLTHFEILGITPTNEVSQIKRAYHKLSRTLHPDAYYGKEIGGFKPMLQELFERARASHDLLVSSEKRDAYVERLLEIERRKLETAAKKSEERRARKEHAKMLERQKKEAEEAKANGE